MTMARTRHKRTPAPDPDPTPTPRPEPSGRVLEADPPVPIDTADIGRALALWDRLAPPELRGLLNARETA
jgi:hypothetical protein